MVKHFLLASTILCGALGLSVPASAVTIGAEASKFDPAFIDSRSAEPTLLIQVNDDQGDDNDDQGDDNDDQGDNDDEQ
jgi:hypothetical protein